MRKDLGPQRPHNLVSRWPPRARGTSFLLAESFACVATEEGQRAPWRGWGERLPEQWDASEQMMTGYPARRTLAQPSHFPNEETEVRRSGRYSLGYGFR